MAKGRNELLTAALILAAFLLINLATSERSPTVWIDEVMFTDPAINLLRGKGFTSAAWSTQPSHTFFAGNAPLHTIVLIPWIACFGQGVVAVRALNYALMLMACGSLWWTLARRAVIRSAHGRALAIVAILCGDGVAYSYRGGRYDCLGMFWMVCLWAVALTESSLRRRVGLMVLGAAIPWTGFQLIPYLGVLSLVYLMTYGGSRMVDVALVWAGVLLGVGGLYLFFASQAAWPYLLNSIHELAGQHRPAAARVADAVRSLRVDPSLMVLYLLLLVAVAWEFSRTRSPERRTLLAGLLFAMLVPAGLAAVGKFARYYAWMAYVPALVCLLRWFEQTSPGKWTQRAFVVGLAAVCLVGLPARMALLLTEWEARDYRPVERFVRTHLRPDDNLYCEFEAYYAAKAVTPHVFLTRYRRAISDTEKAAINVFAARPENASDTAELLGGKWTRVAEHTTDFQRGAWQSRLRMGGQLYHLVVYRRER